VASIGEVQALEVDLSSAKRTTFEEYQKMVNGDRDPRPGDIIYSRNATVGAAALVVNDEIFCVGQDVSLIRSTYQNQKYLVFFLRSPAVMGQLDALVVGATFKRMNVRQIKNLFVAVPPTAEQKSIAEYCSDVHSKIQALLEKIMEGIARLREFRTALISAAVTGKIDVREEVA
jgi:type I restriction enzyme S subunit